MSPIDLSLPRLNDRVATLTRAFEQLLEPSNTLALLARRTRCAPHARLAARAAHLLADLHAEIEREASAL